MSKYRVYEGIEAYELSTHRDYEEGFFDGIGIKYLVNQKLFQVRTKNGLQLATECMVVHIGSGFWEIYSYDDFNYKFIKDE